MRVTTYADPGAFASVAVPLLMRDEAANCLPLGIIDALLNDPARYPTHHLMTLDEGSEPQGVAWMTPRRPLGLTSMPSAAVEALLEYALTLDESVPGVVGPKPAVDEFKALWLSRSGCSPRSTCEQRIYRIDRVTPVERGPGELRMPMEADLDWLTEFAALSQKLLAEGRKFCFLYTDLANPTSNSIYQRIGYQPVCDSAHHTFEGSRR